MQKHSKILKMASSSNRRSDYGEEFVEQLRRDRFKKSYILVNGVNSSEEEDEELDFDEEDDEMASYAMGGHLQQQQPPRFFFLFKCFSFFVLEIFYVFMTQKQYLTPEDPEPFLKFSPKGFDCFIKSIIFELNGQTSYMT